MSNFSNRFGGLLSCVLAGGIALGLPSAAHADENLFGYNAGAETLPKGSGEVYVFNTLRSGKGQGSYNAVDTEIEGEYGVTDRITLSAAASFLTIKSNGLLIDGYLPAAIDKGPRFNGIEVKAKFNVLSPALDNFGLAVITSRNSPSSRDRSPAVNPRANQTSMNSVEYATSGWIRPAWAHSAAR